MLKLVGTKVVFAKSSKTKLKSVQNCQKHRQITWKLSYIINCYNFQVQNGSYRSSLQNNSQTFNFLQHMENRGNEIINKKELGAKIRKEDHMGLILTNSFLIFFFLGGVQKMQVVAVPKDSYGIFYTGDSYIIACVRTCLIKIKILIQS